MTYPICGNCMHSMSSHSRISDTLMYCASCMNSCDDIDCHTKHNPSGSIVQDGVFYQIKREKK